MDEITVPITMGFRDDLEALIGKAMFTKEGMAQIKAIIEAGAVPNFAISFIGNPDDNGVYHDAKLLQLSMVFEKK